ncbi:MAG TPA: SDR family oxidoreductase [Pirellulales bacterium]|jgi:NAD(P)-dependent dehydrogenase (short-subunit alcohol dehydrogenase family)|nr:SDR family oxidoreductase [Pirellulales bacterium]
MKTKIPKAEPREQTVAAAAPKPPFPPKKLDKPGVEADLEPKPKFRGEKYRAAGKLEGKVALITGGDSGIGRAVAVFFAREKADVVINHLPEEQEDADATKQEIEALGQRCVAIAGDLTDPNTCSRLIEQTIEEFGRLDILVSNAAHQNRKPSIDEISEEEWDRTFKTNVYAPFHLIKAALPHLKEGASIIITSSETGLFGNKQLLDYSSTKGALNAFVKSLAQNLVEKGIRVNAVAPGPVWTPLNPADTGLPAEKLKEFGKKTPMGRPGQPEEMAPAYVFFASDADSSYITGHVLPLLGGEVAGA